MSPETLNERPRQTTLDWLVTGPSGVIAVEAKFTEQGFGRCSCEGRAEGSCAARVLERPYWRVASEMLGLERTPAACALSVVYQPVRNIAAANALAGQARTASLLACTSPHSRGSACSQLSSSILESSSGREKHGIIPA